MCLLLKDLKHYVLNGRMVFGKCIFFLWIVQLDRFSSKTSPLLFLFKHTVHMHISHVIENAGILGEAQEITEF